MIRFAFKMMVLNERDLQSGVGEDLYEPRIILTANAHEGFEVGIGASPRWGSRAHNPI